MAFVTGRPSPLPDLPLHYADYAYWQREWLQGEVLETQLAYWRGQLGTNLSETPLPLDRPRPAQQSFRGAHQSFVLSKELSDKLKALSHSEGVTTFMLALGGFKALLHSYSGATDIVVGTDVANRNHIETEGLIGFFANQLVLRTDLSGDPSFSEILARVREVALGAYAHQDLPFDKVVEILKPERDLSRNPLFQVMFGFNNAPMSGLTMPELSLTSFPLQNGTAVFDLSFYLTDTQQGCTGMVRFNTDIFDMDLDRPLQAGGRRQDRLGRRLLGRHRRARRAVPAAPGRPLPPVRQGQRAGLGPRRRRHEHGRSQRGGRRRSPARDRRQPRLPDSICGHLYSIASRSPTARSVDTTSRRSSSRRPQKDARAFRDEVDRQMRARNLPPLAELAISDEPEAKKVLRLPALEAGRRPRHRRHGRRGL